MQMKKEPTFKEVSFLSYTIGDISALQTECYSLHTRAHKHAQFYKFSVPFRCPS